MDDRNFDQQTAQDWINSVERPGKSWRDENVYQKLSVLIREASPKMILDIGCGQGICSEKIELGQSHYTGVEPSPFLLDRAKSLYSSTNRKFFSGNAYNLPVPDQSYDIAFSILVWHLLRDLDNAAFELSRVLVEDGQFFIITANPEGYLAWKSFYPDAKMNGKKLEGTMQLGDALSQDVIYLHSFEEIKESLEKFSLSIEKTETFLLAKDFEMNLLILIQGKRAG